MEFTIERTLEHNDYIREVGQRRRQVMTNLEQVKRPPNLRNRSPPPPYYSGNNSLNDYDEKSAEVADATEASPVTFFLNFVCFVMCISSFLIRVIIFKKTNDHNESNVEITRKEDDNPFDARTDEGSTKYKVSINRH